MSQGTKPYHFDPDGDGFTIVVNMRRFSSVSYILFYIQAVKKSDFDQNIKQKFHQLHMKDHDNSCTHLKKNIEREFNEHNYTKH